MEQALHQAVRNHKGCQGLNNNEHQDVNGSSLYMVNQLIMHGAPLDGIDGDGNTPLHIACYNWFIDLAVLLIKNCASIAIPNKKSETPLHLLKIGYEKLVRANQKRKFSDKINCSLECQSNISNGSIQKMVK